VRVLPRIPNARCLEWFSAADPMQLHVTDMVGRDLWANPPYQIVGAVLDALVAAWSQDRAHTVPSFCHISHKHPGLGIISPGETDCLRH
jgi:hypothetical protein